MGKNKSASGLINVINYDNFGNISFVSGSTTLMQVSSSGAITTTGVISGSSAQSASLAQNSNLLQGTGSVGFATTASFTTASGSISTRVTQIEQVYATTGSNSFRATQSITGSLTVTGQIVAQTLNVQQVTSSIIYSSGSNVFGCDINSRQTFTGSVFITGSTLGLYSNVACFYGNTLVVSGSNNVGIGDIPSNSYKLYVNGSSTGGGLLLYSGNSCSNYPLVVGDYATNTYFHVNGVGTVYSRCNVGIGTTNPASSLELLVGSPKITLTPSAYSGAYRTVLGTRSGAEGVLQLGNNNPNYIVGGNTAGGGSLHFYVNATCDFVTSTNGTLSMVLASTGVATFSHQVCAPQLIVCKTYNANNLMLSVANSTMSVPFMTYDTAIIQADDVTTLKLVERNGGSTDNQILTLSVGDNTTRISTNGPNPLQFFVGGSSAGCGYNGLGGNNALSIACSGISTFNNSVYIGSMGHHTNYRSTSGCFAIFCASQGAILYVTSMHNNGRATYQLVYSNGPTGGASISVNGQTSAYGPACTAFGLCANGWVYGYQPYGGPTDYYAISINSNFQWAF